MMQEKFSDEIRLILACARSEPDSREIGEISNLVRYPLDWEFILKQAAYHNIIPLIYHNLNKIDKKEIMPSHISSRLRESYQISLAWNLLLAKELHLVIDVLNNAGIDMIPIKGIVLAELLYSNIALRVTGDIDILIKGEYMLAADKALSQIGYYKDVGGYPEKYYIEHHCHMPYRRVDERGRRFLCEVHWALSFPRPNIISLPNLWKRVSTQKIDNMDIHCLSCEDTFFSLILHLRRYAVPLSLRYICDITRLITLNKNRIDWDYIVTESRKNRIISTAYFTLYFARKILDSPVSEDVLNRFNPGFIRKKCLQCLIKNITFSKNTKNPKARQYVYVFLRFLIYDRTMDFLSYIIFIPIEEFARFYKLPLGSKKTRALYHIRIIYILFRSIFNIKSILKK